MKWKPFLFMVLTTSFWSCGDESANQTTKQETDETENMAPLTDASEYIGVYHFGDSEWETSLIINMSKGQYFAQLQAGHWNDEGTAWIFEYENFKNVRIEGNKFFSDKTNGEFLISEESGEPVLKVEQSWSYEGESEVGYKSAEVQDFYYGDYSEASYRELEEEDLELLTKEELQLMRNEIFARYDFKFKQGGDMDTYFRMMDWYHSVNKNVDAFLTPLEKENITLLKKLEKERPAITDPLSPDEMEAELAGNWICNSSKHFTLSPNGMFSSMDYNYDDKGDWWLEGQFLHIALDNDTVIFEITHMDRSKMIIKNIRFKDWHYFLCQTGSDYRIYSTLYKERPAGRNEKAALAGFWYKSEGFELKPDGKYIHHGPDCSDGTWEYRNHEIIVNEDGCGGSTMTFELLTSERLVLNENWTLYRMHPEEHSIPTPKSEHQ
ncbi:MAG: YARHG domain-containing protein [Flavobacteriales bacterium]|nr:YARHG domain-containing protein [Flavobacteriales bacterium]